MIDGKVLRDAIISAANNLANNRQKIDALNVFPVPDGDTGTNMTMTITAAKRELELAGDELDIAEISHMASSALLRGARGNSGVIMSLLFRGIAKGFQGKKTANARELADAFASGVEAAYSAVMKPTEGTILTVARLAAAHAREIATPEMSCADLINEILVAAEETLEQTPEMLPVLKKAGVVDAGGKGFCVIIEGMLVVAKGGKIIEPAGEKSGDDAFEAEGFRNSAGEIEGEITFTYCTEFIVNRDRSSSVASLRAFLETIGDSAVVVDDDDIIKVHVHTDNPGNALQEGLKHGSLTNIKIENMREQYAQQQKIAKSAHRNKQDIAYAKVDPSVEYGFVAVCAGDGLEALFGDLGCNRVVSGGQTMNPSTDDIVKAVHAVAAKNVFVLPNNKNIIMAAEQAVALCDRRVIVVQTKTIPQGVSAMLTFDPSLAPEKNLMQMAKASEKVQTGLITFAARDSEFDGHRIKKDELLGLENGKLAFTEQDCTKALIKLVRSMLKKDAKADFQFVTVIYGADITEEEAENAITALKEKLGDNVELNLIYGGQPVYYYMISVE